MFTGTSQYASQWKLVVTEYNAIRARLYTSEALLEGTNFMLYNINQGILVSLINVTTNKYVQGYICLFFIMSDKMVQEHC